MTTIQATSKQYKGRMAVGAILIAFGLIVAFSSGQSYQQAVTGAVIAVIGAGLYFGARIGAWWHHK